MNVAEWVRCGLTDQHLTELAERVATACHHQAWDQAEHRAGSLETIQEVHAYLRTRTDQLVRVKARGIIRADQQATARCESAVVHRALSLISMRLAGPMLQAAPERRAA